METQQIAAAIARLYRIRGEQVLTLNIRAHRDLREEILDRGAESLDRALEKLDLCCVAYAGELLVSRDLHSITFDLAEAIEWATDRAPDLSRVTRGAEVRA